MAVPTLDDAPGRNLEIGSGRALHGIPLDAPISGDGLVRIVRMNPVLVVVSVHKKGRPLPGNLLLGQPCCSCSKGEIRLVKFACGGFSQIFLIF